MKKIILNTVANVRFGLNGKSSDEFDIPFITARSITNESELDWPSIHCINKNSVNEKDYLRNGEVLFAAKGHRNKAIVWRGENFTATASSTFLIINLNTTEVLPEFLALYLESKKAKAHFAKHTRESTIPTIKKGSLLDLELIVPGIKKQESIVRLSKLVNEEVKLMKDLIDNKQKLVNVLV